MLRTFNDLDAKAIRSLYERFDLPIATLDCGKECALYNPNGMPFCCDISHAVPTAYRSEWAYLRKRTTLWREWAYDKGNKADARLRAETPHTMTLLACLGPAHCQRTYRALSCRQFPILPYVTSDYRFIGLAYESEFESRCWVISHLSVVSEVYRTEYIRTFDHLFSLFQDIFEDYAHYSEKMRRYFIGAKRRIPLIHRKGGYYLVSPRSERIQRIASGLLPKFGPYVSKVDTQRRD